MNPSGKIIVVTGGASGIGEAVCRKLVDVGATVVVSDRDGDSARALAQELGCVGLVCDVSQEADIAKLISTVETQVGPIDIFMSNAGILTGVDLSFENAASPSDEVWTKAWEVNVLSHVRVARILVPLMRARGGGYLINTISAAGLLSQIGGAVYSTTKHAAIGFAENLAITHRKDNIRVSAICPEYVDTAMVEGVSEDILGLSEVLTPAQVAEAVLDGIHSENFLILPHAKVAGYVQNKAADTDRWLAAMSDLQAHIASKMG